VVYFKINSPFNHISEVNKYIKIGEFKLLSEKETVKALLDEKFANEPGFGGESYFNEAEGIKIEFSGFPDVIDKYVLTEIATTNSQHSLYDIHPGDENSKAEQVLIENAFEKSKDINRHTFKRGRISVSLQISDEGKIQVITISLESSNKNNVIF
jgi:hypothetical protein